MNDDIYPDAKGKLRVKRCHIYSIFDGTGRQVSYDCASKDEAEKVLRDYKKSQKVME